MSQPTRRSFKLSAGRRALLDALLDAEGIAPADEQRVAAAELTPAPRAAYRVTLAEADLPPEHWLWAMVAPGTDVTLDRLPTSYSQQQLWLLDRFAPGEAAYNLLVAVRLRGTLDPAALRRSLDLIVERHETLRTTFGMHAGQPVQLIAPHLSLPLPTLDLRDLAPDAQAARVQQAATAEAQRPFDLEHGPLLRAQLLQLAADEHVLLLNMHHIISDGWSLGVLLRELGARYAAQLSPSPEPIAPLAVQYGDYAVWQRRLGEAPDGLLDRELGYWREQLRGLPALELPTDHPRPAAQSFRGDHESLAIDPALTAALEALGQAAGVTLFMTLLTAFMTLLHRYSQQDEIVVGTPIAGRTDPATEPLIGFFVNMLTLRADLGGDPSFRAALGRVRERCLEAYAHQTLPFEQVVAAVRPQRVTSRMPLFSVVFAMQTAPLPPLALPGLTLEPLELASGLAKYDLSLNLLPSGQGWRGMLEYSTDLFDAATIRRMVEHWAILLASIVADPDQRLSALPLISEAERRLLEEWESA